MRRFVFVTVISAALTAGMVAALVSPATAATSPAHAGALASPCTGTIQITNLAFDPLPPGATSAVLHLAAQNCTDQAQQIRITWYGHVVGSTGGIPLGCPVFDPIAGVATFPPGGTYDADRTYALPPSCQAGTLQITVSFSDATGAQLLSRTASVVLSGASRCTVSYERQAEWPGGFVAQVHVANTGTTPVNGWSLTMLMGGDQTVSGAWSAQVHQAGATVTAGNMSYNVMIAPGSNTSFGVIGTWHLSDASPTAFTLNGATCTPRS